jgi:perosamine synthetase
VTASIPNAVPYLGGNEWRYVKECLDTNWVSSAGPFVERFERAVASYVGARYAVATVNGTAALHLSLLLADVGPEDEVLVPSCTFIATANAIRYCGAVPVFMDSEPGSWCIDPRKVEEFLATRCERRDDRLVNRGSGRRVAALVPVHLYGHPADLDALTALTARYPLALVEDTTEALGALYKGRSVGVRELVACLSFNGNKIITCGGGGMVLTDQEALARRAASLSTQGRVPGVEFLHHEVGYNYRLTNIQAALGLAQLEQLDRFVEDKRATADYYAQALGSLAGAQPFREQPWARSTYWMSSVLLDPAAWDVRRLIAAAAAAAIELRPLWYPLHRQPVFAGCEAFCVEVADMLHARGVSLPCSVGISPGALERVVAFLADQRR